MAYVSIQRVGCHFPSHLSPSPFVLTEGSGEVSIKGIICLLREVESIEEKQIALL